MGGDACGPARDGPALPPGGWALAVGDGGPVRVVDLAGDAVPPLPAPFPAVVIGRHRTGAAAAPVGVDIALTEDPSAPAPWVAVDDVDAATDRLVAAATASPLAAVTLVQVLRAGGRGPVGADLVLESLAYSTLQSGPDFARWRAGRPAPAAPAVVPTGPGGPEPVLVERHGGRLEVTLNRPGRHNAFDAATRDGLFEALSLALVDDTVTDVVLAGRGPSFCSGGDLREFGSLPDPAAAHLIRTTRSCGWLLSLLADRVTVHLHGHCIGAGIELAAFAGTVVAHPGTAVALPEVGLGLIPGAGGTASIPRRIGTGRTAWLALSGEVVGARRAREWGLVDVVAG